MVVGMAGNGGYKEGDDSQQVCNESFYRITERQANGDGRSCPIYTLALFFQETCKRLHRPRFHI